MDLQNAARGAVWETSAAEEQLPVGRAARLRSKDPRGRSCVGTRGAFFILAAQAESDSPRDWIYLEERGGTKLHAWVISATMQQHVPC